MSEPEPILIIGSGALACLFAARLAAAGQRVRMLGGWPEGLQALQQHGVRLVDGDGRERAYPVQASAEPRDCAGARQALVLVKAWQTARAARSLATCLAADGLALSLQNGLGNREKLVEQLGEARVALGVATVGATLLGPGRVRAGGEGSLTWRLTPQSAPLAARLRGAGFQVEDSPDTQGLLWGKLVINAAINPLTALLQVPNGELLARPSARQLMGALAGETAAVARALDVQLPFPDPVAAAEAVARRTASNHSSMLQDVRRGAPTEIEAICGAIVRTGEWAGVPTPTNRMMWQLVKALRGGDDAYDRKPH